MALIKPTELGDNGVWASLLDAMFDLIDQHDHSPGKGARVPMATGVSVGADVPWNSGGSYFAITNLKAIDFQPQPASGMTTYAGALFVDSATNELNWRTTGGANVRITDGTGLNISLAGVIGGDYASVGALVDYTDTTDTYALRQQLGGGVRQFARLQSGDVDLYEFKAHPTGGVPANRVRLKSPAGLVSSYDLTWLTALPGTTTPLQVSSAGLISASNTFANATTFTGLATLSAGATAAAGQHISVSGTGKFKYGTVTDVFSSFQIVAESGCSIVFGGSTEATITASTASPIWKLGIQGVRVGTTISAVRVRGRITSNPMSFQLQGASTGASSSANISSGSDVTVSLAVSWTVIAENLWIAFFSSGVGGGTQFFVKHVEIDYGQA